MADQASFMAQMPELVPTLTVSDPRASLEWFEKLGFQTVFQMAMPDGAIMHAHLARGGAQLMLGPACPDSAAKGMAPGSTGMDLYITLRDETADALYERARAAGITIGEEPRDQFWGDRTFQVRHPDGYRIWFAQHVRDVSPEEMHRAAAEWAATAVKA